MGGTKWCDEGAWSFVMLGLVLFLDIPTLKMHNLVNFCEKNFLWHLLLRLARFGQCQQSRYLPKLAGALKSQWPKSYLHVRPFILFCCPFYSPLVCPKYEKPQVKLSSVSILSSHYI